MSAIIPVYLAVQRLRFRSKRVPSEALDALALPERPGVLHRSQRGRAAGATPLLSSRRRRLASPPEGHGRRVRDHASDLRNADLLAARLRREGGGDAPLHGRAAHLLPSLRVPDASFCPRVVVVWTTRGSSLARQGADRRRRRSSTSPAPPTSIASATRRPPERASRRRAGHRRAVSHPEPSRACRGEWRGGEGRPRSRRVGFPSPGDRAKDSHGRTQPGNHEEFSPRAGFRARCQNDRARPPPATAFLAGTLLDHDGRPPARARADAARAGASARVAPPSASKATTKRIVRRTAHRGSPTWSVVSLSELEPRVVAQRRFLLLRRRRGRAHLVRARVRVRAPLEDEAGEDERRRFSNRPPSVHQASDTETAARGFARLVVAAPTRRSAFPGVGETFASPLRERAGGAARVAARAQRENRRRRRRTASLCRCRLRRVRRAWARRVPPRRRRVAPARARAGARGGGRRGGARRAFSPSVSRRRAAFARVSLRAAAALENAARTVRGTTRACSWRTRARHVPGACGGVRLRSVPPRETYRGVWNRRRRRLDERRKKASARGVRWHTPAAHRFMSRDFFVAAAVAFVPLAPAGHARRICSQRASIDRSARGGPAAPAAEDRVHERHFF